RNLAGPMAIAPLTWLSKTRVIPHWSLLSTNIEVTPQGLSLDGQLASTSNKGHLLINQITHQEIDKNTTNIKIALVLVEKKMPLKFVKEGDTVIILPKLFTGHGEWTQTPLGTVPSSFVKVSAVNSALTGSWIDPPSGQWL